MIRKLLIGFALAGSLVGCRTEYPATGADDRGVVAPDRISNQKSNNGDPVLWDMPLWWEK